MKVSQIFASWVALAISSFPALSAEIKVPDDVSTIQGAIDKAADGDAITIGPGIYKQQFLVHSKSIRINGSPGTTLRAFSGMKQLLLSENYPHRALINCFLGHVTISGLNIEGEGLAAADGATPLAGILLANASGIVSDCRFTAFRGTKLGTPSDGVGVVGINASHSGINPTNRTEVSISRSLFADNRISIQLIGNEFEEPLQLRTHFLIEECTIVGNGPDPGPFNQSGIIVLAGAGGEIRKNFISEFSYLGTDAHFGFGVVAFEAPGPNDSLPVPVQHIGVFDNTFKNNQIHINPARGLGSEIARNRFIGSGQGRRATAIANLAGGSHLIENNSFENVETGILAIGDDPEFGTSIGIATNVTIHANYFCGVRTNVTIEPLVTGVKETDSRNCASGPTLSIATAVEVGWEALTGDYTLESGVTLSGPWTRVTKVSALQAGLLQSLSVPVEHHSVFYRLWRER